MARPTRQGVDYFPLDIHLDDKFKFIQIKYGLEGFAVVIKLMQKIYSYGYWYQWGEDESLIFAHENAIEVDKLDVIIEETIKRGIFHEGIYKSYQVLTSSGIQKRYKEIVKRRKDVEIVIEYLLLDNNFGVSTIIEPTECIHDANIEPTKCIHDTDVSTQSKVDKSKIDKSIKTYSATEIPKAYILDIKVAEVEAYKQLLVMKEKVEFISKMKTIYTPIIEYLNTKSGKNYRATGNKTQDLINARLNDGFTLEDFFKVIDIKVAEWKGNDFDKFLRPETLFSNKFEGYLNQDVKAKNNKHDTKFHVTENRTDNYTNKDLEDVVARKRREAREKLKGAN